MLKRTKLAILALSLFTASAAMAANQQSEGGYIPIDGIFVSGSVDGGAEMNADGGNKVQSVALAGLLMSVFIVVGTGRAYSQLHDRLQKDLATAEHKHAEVVRESVTVHDHELIETMAECERLDGEIADLEYQLSQIQQEV